jgi:hypothetical protein
MKLNKSLEKEQIREVTKVALLTNMKQSSAIGSYGRLLHARGAWVAPMVLPCASE